MIVHSSVHCMCEKVCKGLRVQHASNKLVCMNSHLISLKVKVHKLF